VAAAASPANAGSPDLAESLFDFGASVSVDFQAYGDLDDGRCLPLHDHFPLSEFTGLRYFPFGELSTQSTDHAGGTRLITGYPQAGINVARIGAVRQRLEPSLYCLSIDPLHEGEALGFAESGIVTVRA